MEVTRIYMDGLSEQQVEKQIEKIWSDIKNGDAETIAEIERQGIDLSQIGSLPDVPYRLKPGAAGFDGFTEWIIQAVQDGTADAVKEIVSDLFLIFVYEKLKQRWPGKVAKKDEADGGGK